MRRALIVVLVLLLVAALGAGVWFRLDELKNAEAQRPQRPPAPVEVMPLRHEAITLRRTYSGALEAMAEFVAAPKVAGQIKSLPVDLGDPVRRGQVVARLEDDELRQAELEATAELAVAEAELGEARSALVLAERELKRLETLFDEGVSSESDLDSARTQESMRRARVSVAEANRARAEAALEARRIRRGYGQVTADWTEGDDERVVASRFVDEGETVGVNAPLLTIVEVDPIVGVVFVPERDYARLAVGQSATLSTDAHPGEEFRGTVRRISPVFSRSTRQARVELSIPNADQALKPGMFARASLELRRVEDAIVAPYDAITQRGDETGVFLYGESSNTVRWCPVEVGVRDGARVQLTGEGLEGWVVSLGQELCDDGATVVAHRVEEAPSSSVSEDDEAAGSELAPPGARRP